MTQETRSQTLSGRGRYAYSTLGAATAGQAVAAAAHMSYAKLMRTRLFAAARDVPHRPSRTTTHWSPAGSLDGAPVRPWVMSAYAPGRCGLHHR